MAGEEDLKARILIEAQDRASDVLRHISSELGTFGQALEAITSTGGIAAIAIAGLGAALGIVTKIGLDVSSEVEQLDLLSTRSGVSVEALQVLRQEVREMGGDADTLTTALSFLNRALATDDPILAQLGITTRDTFTAFQQLSKAFANSDDTAKKTEIAYQLLGRGSASLLGILPKLAANFDNVRDSMSAMGGIMTGDVLAAARHLDEEADRLGRNWSSLMTKMRADTVGAANGVVESLNDMWDAASGRKKSPEEQAARTFEELTRQMEGFRERAAHPDLFVQGDAGTKAFVAEMNKQADAIQLQIDKLKGLRAQTEDEEFAILDALDKVAARKKDHDAIGDVTLKKGETKEKTAREQEIEHIMRATGALRAEATQTYDALQRLGDAKFAQSIKDQLTFGPEMPESLKKYNEEVEQMKELFPQWSQRASEMVDKIHELGDEATRANIMKKLFPEQAIGAALKKTLEQVLSFAGVVEDTMASLYESLLNGFYDAFQQIAAGTATLASTMKSIMSAVISAIIAELAKLAAALVVRTILAHFPGGGAAVSGPPTLLLGGPSTPGVATAIANLGRPGLKAQASASPIASFGRRDQTPQVSPVASFGRRDQKAQPSAIANFGRPEQKAQPSAQPLPMQPTGNTYNIYGFDNLTLVQQLISPRGALRSANERIAIQAAY